MAMGIHNYVGNCKSCCMNGPSRKSQRWMQVFLPSGALEFVVIDIIEPLPRQSRKLIYGFKD